MSIGDGRNPADRIAKTIAGYKLQGPEVGPGLGGPLAWRSTAGGVVQLAGGPNGESIVALLASAVAS